jgi:hypothetical protein
MNQPPAQGPAQTPIHLTLLLDGLHGLRQQQNEAQPARHVPGASHTMAIQALGIPTHGAQAGWGS